MADTPDLEEIAGRTRRKYPEYEAGVCYGFLLRAVRRGATGTPVAVEATTEEMLLDGIARQIRMRELDAMCAGRSR